MAKGLFEVLVLAEDAVSAAESWGADLWDRTKVLLPAIAKRVKVVCAGIGHLPADRIGAAVTEWRHIEIAATEKRAAAGQGKRSLGPCTWNAAERRAWRASLPASDGLDRKEASTVSGDKRRSLSPEEEADILQKCLRRCCVCYALDGDDSEKKGHLAHLDHNRANGHPDNFVFLCLVHHNAYDTRMPQAKNMTEREVRGYRRRLHEAVEQGRVPGKGGPARTPLPAQQAPAISVHGNGNVVAGGDVNYVVNAPKAKRGKARLAARRRKSRPG